MAIKITAVGDIMPCDGFYSCGFGMGTKIEEKGGYHPYKYIQPELKGDIIIGNLECPISIKGNHHKMPLMGGIEAVNGLKKAGFTILNVANNHILQYGTTMHHETMETLRNNGMTPINHLTPIPIEKKGEMIGFYGFSLINSPTGVYCTIQDVLKTIKPDDHDHTIISLHWGKEFIPMPEDWQIKMAHKLIDKGADIIIGHHSHNVQPITRYKEGIIIYSLGNFISDMTEGRSTNGCIITMDLDSHDTAITPTHMGKDLCCRRGWKQVSALWSVGMERRLHVLRNIYRYDPPYLYSLIKNAINRRRGKI